jgi:hypothetical protein
MILIYGSLVLLFLLKMVFFKSRFLVRGIFLSVSTFWLDEAGFQYQPIDKAIGAAVQYFIENPVKNKKTSS